MNHNTFSPPLQCNRSFFAGIMLSSKPSHPLDQNKIREEIGDGGGDADDGVRVARDSLLSPVFFFAFSSKCKSNIFFPFAFSRNCKSQEQQAPARTARASAKMLLSPSNLDSISIPTKMMIKKYIRLKFSLPIRGASASSALPLKTTEGIKLKGE